MQRQIDEGVLFEYAKTAPRQRPYYTLNSSLGFFAAENNPHYFAPNQLFDLQADPRETRNVIAEHPAVAAQLQARLAGWLRTFPDRPFGEFNPVAQPETPL